MKKIMLSLAVIAIVAVGAIGATRAYFTGIATSGNNTFVAGNMTLAFGSDSQPGVYQQTGITFATASNLAPGEVSPAYNLYYKNGGTIDGKVKLAISYASAGNGTDADAFATKMVIANASLDGDTLNVAPLWAQQIIAKGGLVANGQVVVNSAGGYLPTIYGLSKISVYFTNSTGTGDTTWAPGATHYTTLKLMLDPSADNDYQGKGINIIVNGTMNQLGDSATW